MLVAAALVSLLAMAALAIDVVTLYVARNEIQRAADAAALAGAKGIADSGITTLQTTDSNYAAAETLAQSMASAAIDAVRLTNLVAGQIPTLDNIPTPVYTNPNNPYITVTLKQANLPTFFARIWGAGTSTVIASATAEVYNPSNTSPYTPITPTSVKPWLVANQDPVHPGSVFITLATGQVEAGVVGESFDLFADCNTSQPGCTTLHKFGTNTSGGLDYVPALVAANTANVCPSSCVGSTDFERSIACADANPYACGGLTPNASWDSTLNPVAPGTEYSANATECLLHITGSGSGQGQDSLAPISPGFIGPPQITGGVDSPAPTQLVSTSNSIVTIPIIDDQTFSQSSAPVTIVGYMQAFVNWVEANNNINITILNISGCSQTPNSNAPVVGGSGTSPLPVRLITPPSS